MPEMEPNIGLRLEYTCYSVRHQGKQWQKCHEQPCFYNPALFPPACNSLRQKVRQSVNGTGKNFMKNVFHYITNTRCFPTTNNGDHMLDTAYFFTVFFCFRSKKEIVQQGKKNPVGLFL